MKIFKLAVVFLVILVSAFVYVIPSCAENWTDRINRTNDAVEWAKEEARRNIDFKILIKEQLLKACLRVSFRGDLCDTDMRKNDGFFSGLLNSWCSSTEESAKECEAKSYEILNSLENLPECSEYPSTAFQDFESSDACIKRRAYVVAEWIARMTVGFEHKCNIIPVANKLSLRYPMIDFERNQALVDVKHTGTGYYRHPIDWSKCNK